MATRFEDFCGGQFWNTSLTWGSNASWPQFTSCFENTLLIWVPCGWLWITLPLYVYYLVTRSEAPLRLTWLNIFKTFCALLLFVLAIVEIIEAAGTQQEDGDVSLTFYVTPSIKAATLLLSVVLLQVERRCGFITSGIQTIFWFLFTIQGVIPFYSFIILKDESVVLYAIFYVEFAFTLIEFLLHFKAEPLPEGYFLTAGKPCPEVEASFLSRISFWWINGVVRTGFKKSLEETDLWNLNPRDQGENFIPQFEEAWSAEVHRVQQLQAIKDRQSSHYVHANNHSTSEKTPLLNGTSLSEDVAFKGGKYGSQKEDTSKEKKKGASLLKVLAKRFLPTLLISWGCKFIYDLLQFVSPMILQLLIGFTEDKTIQSWKGYIYAIALLGNALIQSCCFHQQFHIGMTLGMRIKAAVIAAVYQKALTMNNEARKTSTVGEIVNLMSVDAQRLQDITGYLWMLWSAPFQIGLALYLLYGTMGSSIFAGLAIMVLMLPINAVIAIKTRKLQVTQMKLKDTRIKLMNEVLNGMKVLKLYAWELSFQEKVLSIRNQELQVLKKTAYLGAFSTFAWTCAPFMVTLATFATYVLTSDDHRLDAQKAFVALSLFNILRFPINLLPMIVSYVVQVMIATFSTFVSTSSDHVLTAEVAFVSLSLFNILRFPLNTLPFIISSVIQAQVSIGRIGRFLQNGDLNPDNVQHNPNAGHPITVERGVFSWDKTEKATLRNVNLEVKDGELVAVVGQVGAGKSSLMAALLGEMEKLEGNVNVRGSIAYVPQQAWIQNSTLQDNILFGAVKNDSKYREIVDACALGPDLEMLPGGDMTEIGEKGINLSGGQKQRVSLARAVYNDADVYLLDDPLSAVDAHVGKHIFEKVVGAKGILKKKTRILVTHGIHWLPMVDRIAVITDGEISEIGTYEELLSHHGAFAQFIHTYLTQEQESSEDEDDQEVADIKARILERVDSVLSESEKTSGDEAVRRRRRKSSARVSDPESDFEQKKLKRQDSRKKLERSVSMKDAGKDDEKRSGNKLIELEKSETGKVKLSVYFAYGQAIGVLASILILFLFALYQVGSVYSNVWLSFWTEDPTLMDESLKNTSEYAEKNNLYLGVYGGLGLGQALFVLLYAIMFATCQVKAAAGLHLKMLENIFRSPMAFFDTTPIGRIVNRFSRDIETIDNNLPQIIRMFMNTVFTVASTLIVISSSTPIFLSVIVPLAIFYLFIQRFYIPTSRQLKRLESTTRSPIYTHFSESITGCSTIRAYGMQDRFIKESQDRVDKNLVFYFCGIASNRWLGFRLEVVGNLIVLAAAMFAVSGRDTLTGGLVGLSISYALQVTGSLNWMVRMSSDLETNVVSVERVKEYSETPTEADWYIPERKPRRDWPPNGVVEFKDYTTRYRPGLDLVIKGITCHINSGEKVGIVGRTGAGKSSLTVALFRLIESAGGAIVIDGVNISDIGLHDLRSKLTILPQDPVIFSGTLRMNVDPFDLYTDAQIWQALEHSHLKGFVEGLTAGLEHECGEGGQNLSVGQRQLVCLARTLLRKTKILVLDEATAAVDMETDDLIQKTIRTEFKDCTVLTIAHRLNTIMDYDRIIVLDQGIIKEFGNPDELLKNKQGAFYGMAKDAGLV